MDKYDVAIIGGGMSGLSVAWQLIERSKRSLKIIIFEKERECGTHSSGRNSGVIHAGIYYKPNSLKSKVCVTGARRLTQWIKQRELALNICGKIIVPQEQNLDKQLDMLYERGTKNGAEVYFWSDKELKKFMPQARTSTDRCLWSPNTAVTDPKAIIRRMVQELKEKGVDFFHDKDISFVPEKNNVDIGEGQFISYEYLFNCAGLQSCKVAYAYGVGCSYKIIPFRGNYWKLSSNSSIDIPANLYPVPDINTPFLGVHFTPNSDKSMTSIGPTASPAFGLENYKGFENIDMSGCSGITTIANQYIANKGNFRKYVHEQAFLSLKPLMMKSAQKLIPCITSKDIEKHDKVGIRAQLYSISEQKLVDDFLCISIENSTHVLNAVSPAFTSSFSLGDLIIDQSKILDR